MEPDWNDEMYAFDPDIPTTYMFADADELQAMAEDYGFGGSVMERTDDCNYDFDNYGYAD